MTRACEPLYRWQLFPVSLRPLLECVIVELMNVACQNRLPHLLGFSIRRLANHAGKQRHRGRHLELSERRSSGIEIVDCKVTVRLKDYRTFAKCSGECLVRKSFFYNYGIVEIWRGLFEK